VIDISTRNGVTLVRQVGLKNERQIWTITSDGVQFANISTTCPAGCGADVYRQYESLLQGVQPGVDSRADAGQPDGP
jgi:hypothetical protein